MNIIMVNFNKSKICKTLILKIKCKLMNDTIRNKVTEYKRQNTPEGKTFLHRKKEYNLVNKGISL